MDTAFAEGLEDVHQGMFTVFWVGLFGPRALHCICIYIYIYIFRQERGAW